MTQQEAIRYLNYVRRYDSHIETKYFDKKKQNEDFANHYLKTEYEYWLTNKNNGKYAPEILD